MGSALWGGGRGQEDSGSAIASESGGGQVGIRTQGEGQGHKLGFYNVGLWPLSRQAVLRLWPLLGPRAVQASGCHAQGGALGILQSQSAVLGMGWFLCLRPA